MNVPDLCSVADVKAWLVIPDANNNMDAIIKRCITAFTSYALMNCNRQSFLAANYVEKYNGNGGVILKPRYAFASSPLISITSLTVNGQAIPAAPDDVTGGYAFDLYKIYLRGCYGFCKGVQNIGVSYSAGLAAVPEVLSRACIDSVALWLKRKEFIGHISTSIAGEVVTFDQKDIPVTARMALTQHTRRM